MSITVSISRKDVRNTISSTKYDVIMNMPFINAVSYTHLDTFSKSDFRAVKVKECVAVPKSKKLLQFTLDDGTGTDLSLIHI